MSAKKKLTDEEQAFLDARKATPEEPKEEYEHIPAIVIDRDEFVLKEGESKEKFKEITLRILDVYFKFMRRGSKADNYRPTAESISIRFGDKKPYLDTLGTTNCGRIPTYQIPKEWNGAQKEDNAKKGTFYAVVYGLLGGKVVKFQVPSAKAAYLNEFFTKLEVEDVGQTEVKFTFSDDSHLVAELVKKDLSVLENREVITTLVYPEIERNNKYIMDQHNKNKGENSVADEILDDEIPF